MEKKLKKIMTNSEYSFVNYLFERKKYPLSHVRVISNSCIGKLMANLTLISSFTNGSLKLGQSHQVSETP